MTRTHSPGVSQKELVTYKQAVYSKSMKIFGMEQNISAINERVNVVSENGAASTAATSRSNPQRCSAPWDRNPKHRAVAPSKGQRNTAAGRNTASAGHRCLMCPLSPRLSSIPVMVRIYMRKHMKTM